MQLVPRASPQRAPGAHFVSGLTHPGVPNPPGHSSERGPSEGHAPSPRGTRRAVSACTSGARSVGQIPIRRRALMAPSNLSKRFKLALALLTAVATSGAIPAAAATTLDTCGYIFKSTDPRTYVAFSESTVLRAFSPKGSVRAEPGLTIKVWYNDEHALTLGVRRVVVKTRTGTTTTDYPFTTLATNALDPARNNWNLGSGDPAPAGLSNEGWSAEIRWNVDDLVAAGKMIPGHTYRLQFMVHDGDQNSTGGDSGEGCVNVQPYCTTAADCNDRNACTADSCSAGVCSYTPIAGCKLCTTAADCNDGNACTTDSCNAGVCQNTAIAGCKLCTTATDCDDQNACTTDACNGGVCQSTPIAGCKLCTTDTDCEDQNVCTYDTCNGGVCSNAAIDGCKPCTTTADCDDQNACTVDSCDDGVCPNTSI